MSKQLLNLYGTHLTCSELARNGIIPIITSRNTRGVDVIAASLDGQRTVAIQVKTSQRGRRWPFGDRDFDDAPRSSFYYVFVCPKRNDFDDGVEFYVVPSNVVFNRAGKPHRKWKREHPKKRGVPSFQLRPHDLNEYRNHWENLLAHIGQNTRHKREL